MAEIDDNRKSRIGGVLRATDVIPPFDKDARPANESDGGSEEPLLAQAKKEQPKRERRIRRTPEVGSNEGSGSLPKSPPAVPEIPTFDLAENILAEHRRTAARRRKAPSHVQAKPETRPERAAVRAHIVEPPSQPSQDAGELHRVVAEIVARDIERLCRQPGRPPHEQSSRRGGNR